MDFIMMLALAAAASAGEPAKADNPGEKLYRTKCATCHGKDGKGNEKMAKMFKIKPEELDLTGEAYQKKADADILQVVNEGRKKMPAFKSKLKEAEIAGVLAFVRSLAPAAKTEGEKK